ncbi:RNA-binding (RRM/RBD/RNP motifs) family protein [Tritrichomonas foetus]|uniref:RNA-binding (RRM/RBD/RNP motifs) family protein n=1 Tax=Tritrichomonas foetus TaxID=1144522 RepID=A0A1J4KIU2_9EUKA|nr:RNA-binding (RRM/RBD/RNP motifs) family protein [Tritrichomonas foetus]|eukprot:OHT11263.1 RNA-binding (RRM/RBD/RNP motifs) family protein [Tritrichomonas foetus]
MKILSKNFLTIFSKLTVYLFQYKSSHDLEHQNMDQTRIIIKGLPKYMKDKELSEQFSSSGEITDCKILRTKQGKSRGFAFIGYKTPDQALKAIQDFNNTFVNTSKIFVELAKPIGDESLEECYARMHRTAKLERKQEKEAKEKTTASNTAEKPAGRVRPSLEDDPEYREFLEARRARNIKPSWNEGVVEYIEKHEELKSKQEDENDENENENENEDQKDEKKITETDSTRIFVRNVPYAATESDLDSFFSKFGEVTEVQIPFDKIAQRNRGIAFVTFQSAESVISALNESIIFQGRHLKLQPAEPAPAKPDDLNANGIPDDDETYAQKKKRQLKIEKPESWNALFLNKDTVAEATAHMLGFTKAQILNPESDDIASRLAIAESQLVNDTKKMFQDAGIDLSLFNQSDSGSFSNPKLSKTLIIAKNLKYECTEEEIRNMFAAYGSLVRFIFPPTHAVALVEFARSEDAKKAYQALSFKKVHDQPMYLQWAPASSSSAVNHGDDENDDRKGKNKGNSNNKLLKTTTLIMKNVPFKATKREISDLVNVYAKVKAIRMTKKADGSGHRGFVFLEFNTRQEATAALENLGNVHLYERHLVVQPADVGRNVDSMVQHQNQE